MTRRLRDYQQEGLDAVDAREAAGHTRNGVVMATGLGKTDLIARKATRAAREGRRVHIYAHRADLVDQIIERCRMHAPDISVGRVQGGTKQHRRSIVVAMEPTMRNAKARARMLGPAARYDEAGNLVERAGLVIVDECHHAVSPGYMRVLEWAGCFPDPEHPDREVTPLMGVTATMTRGDKRGLGDVFGESVAFERGIEWAIEHGPSDADPLISAPVGAGASRGWLDRPHGRVVVGEHMDLNKAKISRGDYQDAELGEMVAQDVDQIVKAWHEHAADRITVAFTPNVASAGALAEAFRASGVPTGEVYGNTPQGERRRIYAQLAAGDLRVLVSVMVTTEGWDCPPVSCVLMARPTKLPGLYTQIVGRGLRPSPGTGKSDCLVLDVVGASRTQRLVTLVELFPSAEVNRDEIDALPCEVCGGYVKVPSDRAPMPCQCQCQDCGELVADCRCGAGPRDPDGGRRRLRGPAVYADVDLLGGLSESPLNWLSTRGGISFVSAGKRLAAVIPEGGGRFSAGHCEAWGRKPGVDLVEGVSIEEARAAVEVWARGEGAHERSAPWRLARKSASVQAQELAARLGIESPERYTAGGLSDAIDIARASARFDR